MKTHYLFIAFLLLSMDGLQAQAPQKMSYQAIIRDNNGKLITNQVVGMKLSILQGSTGGNAEYIETHSSSTNINGLVTLQIGGGTRLKGALDSVNWTNGPYFVKTETDPTGGVDYTIVATSELLTVPFAFYAKNGPDKHYIGESFGGGIVFYVYDNGMHGLIAAAVNQGSEVYCQIDSIPYTTNAVRDGYGAGLYNTERILASQILAVFAYQLTYPHQIPVSPNQTAAGICASYRGGGFGDWYLPSKYELYLLYLKKNVVSGLSGAPYWSSTEYSHSGAWVQDFYGGAQDHSAKNQTAFVRAIRSF